MIWQNVKDTLPQKGQEVLIRYKGACNLAIFCEADAAFIVNIGPDIKIRRTDIYWSALDARVLKAKI